MFSTSSLTDVTGWTTKLVGIMVAASQHPHRAKFMTKTRLRWIAAAGALLILGGLVAWQLRPVDYLASGADSRTLVIDVPYAKFRQIMVRKNATAAIVAHGGMTLIDERTDDISVDTSGDDRPILNAILGRSQTDLSAVKQITVSLEDPMLEADRLVLRQQSDITATGMTSTSKSKSAAGRLKNYQTSLSAEPSGEQTTVTIAVNLDVLVNVPKWFTHKADQGVEQAAMDAVAGQTESLQSFIAEHADKRIVLPF